MAALLLPFVLIFLFITFYLSPYINQFTPNLHMYRDWRQIWIYANLSAT